MDTLSHKLGCLRDARVTVMKYASIEDAKNHNDVYKWVLYIYHPGPDGRYNPGEALLSSRGVLGLILHLESCCAEIRSLENKKFKGQYKKTSGRVELVSENGKSEAFLLVSSSSYTFRERLWDMENILKVINELKDADRIGKELIEDYKQLNPQEYEMLKEDLLRADSGNSGTACFIATAVYGSPCTPEVTVLRNFRDDVLCKSSTGKAFVNLYYIVSPSIANFIAGHKKIKSLTMNLLNLLIRVLQKIFQRI